MPKRVVGILIENISCQSERMSLLHILYEIFETLESKHSTHILSDSTNEHCEISE